MTIYSFMKNNYELKPVEVSISFVPGLSQIHFLGLPDAAIKESELRIKSAIRHQGFRIPTGQKTLVHLKPTHLRKSSQGLDLAIAAGILWKTEQLTLPNYENIFLYGELSLTGEVMTPSDLDDLFTFNSSQVIVSGETSKNYDFDILTIENLKGLTQPKLKEKKQTPQNFNRPTLLPLLFSNSIAELIAIIALGEHSALFAGPAGSGKTTLTRAVYPLLRDPNLNTFRRSQQMARLFGQSLEWRPLVEPHHTTTAIGMIGGGVPPLPGEISRAHGGVLIMDEFLEFSPTVQEALREPFETGYITLRRHGDIQVFPAKALLLATTNLCPCGEYIPSTQNHCRCRLTRRRAYFEKLSGPLLDRFQILSFSHKWLNPTEKSSSLSDIQIKVEKARDFIATERQQKICNTEVPIEQIEATIDLFTLKHLLPSSIESRRRRQSLLRVARTIADLNLEKIIKAHHIEKAAELTIYPFQQMKNLLI